MKWIDEVFDLLEAGVVLAEKASECLDRRRPLPKEESKAGLDGRQVSSKPSAPETSDLGEEPSRLHDFLDRNFGYAVILGYGVFLIAFLLFSRVWAIGLAYAAILSINVNLLREKSVYQGIPDVLFRLFSWAVMSFIYLGIFITPVWFIDGIARLILH